jgi:hypothetical protein
MEIKYCRTCAILDPKLQKCRMFGHQVEPAIDFCSKHTTELVTCELCGGQIPKRQSIISVTKGKVNRLVCERCSQLYGTCQLCKNNISCSFETDPSPLPKVIQKQIRQGNMITMTQVRNPERIEITCKKGCPCYDSEGDCARQFGVCERCDNI